MMYVIGLVCINALNNGADDISSQPAGGVSEGKGE